MKFGRICLLGLSTIAVLAGCESKAGTGALVGGGLGAGVGALAGGGTGAAIGAGAGVVGGAIVGAALDASDRRQLERRSPETLRRIDNNQQLSINDIKAMSQAGISDDVIISQIRATNSRYNLSTSQIIDLKNAGVSQRVIDYMINS
ncbi:MAG: hypothetical protein Tsb0015_05390 [Simkaniaceae bacterium]